MDAPAIRSPGSSDAARAMGAATLCLAGLALLSRWRRAPASGLPSRARAAAPPPEHSFSSRPAFFDRASATPAEQPAMPAEQSPGALPAPLVRASWPATDLPGSALPSCPAPGPSAGPARGLHAASAMLAASVLADSALEHYRAQFDNPGMWTPLLVSLATLVAGGGAAMSAEGRAPLAGRAVYATAVAAGVAGTAFHLYNVARKPGGVSWGNLFYAAPLGAPAALSLAGLYGLAGRRVANLAPGQAGPGRALAALTSAGLAGTSAEVALLHFRGAFHNPFMWLPVTLPPVASALMGAVALSARGPGPRLRRGARLWLKLTGLLGLGGVAFHAYGVGRQMGGWRNTRQNVLSGPPLSAPPSYTALALGGLAALALIEGA